MKRIFNILSLTIWILRCYQTQKELLLRRIGSDVSLMKTFDSEISNPYFDMKKYESGNISTLAHELVTWVILTDQWPFRMNYLLQVIDDNGTDAGWLFDNSKSLCDVYKNFVLPELNKMETESNISASLDGDARSFCNYLKELDGNPSINITIRKAKHLGQVANVDQSIKQYVIRHRVKVASSVAIRDETVPTGRPSNV